MSPWTMRRHVSSVITGTVTQQATMVLSVAVSSHADVTHESLEATVDGVEIPLRELTDVEGTRLHQLEAPVGSFRCTYSAQVEGRSRPAEPAPIDAIVYARPSRYGESDTLAPTATAEFGHLADEDLLPAISSWVGTRLSYVPGSSQPTDGAVATLLAREGVCRDYAHLTLALLRARDIPARLVSVYAPGLHPMDFHAVTEALVDGRWVVVDATTLAPRSTLVRIATGRDAADTAFLTVTDGGFELDEVSVQATADELPDDDVREQVSLG